MSNPAFRIELDERFAATQSRHGHINDFAFRQGSLANRPLGRVGIDLQHLGGFPAGNFASSSRASFGADKIGNPACRAGKTRGFSLCSKPRYLRGFLLCFSFMRKLNHAAGVRERQGQNASVVTGLRLLPSLSRLLTVGKSGVIRSKAMLEFIVVYVTAGPRRKPNSWRELWWAKSASRRVSIG